MNLNDANRISYDAPIEENEDDTTFLLAIQNERKRKEITAILESAGLLRA